MELITLSDTFQPVRLIEKYAGLVWSERYAKNGDFVLQAFNIDEMRKLLPLESYVSLRETTVPMVVEYHKIKNPNKGTPYIEITGRSFETCLERRLSVKDRAPTGLRPVWNIAAEKESDAAYQALRMVIGDVARYKLGVLQLPAVAPAVTAKDAIPQVDLTLPLDFNANALALQVWNTTTSYVIGDRVYYNNFVYTATATSLNLAPATNPSKWNQNAASFLYEIKPGYLYQTALELLNVNHRGIKSVRPADESLQIGVEIYNGADLRETVVFDARYDQYEDSTYLLGKQGSANVAYIYGPEGSAQVLKTAADEPEGLERRVMLIDVPSETTATNPNLWSRGLIELYKNNVTALFDGQIAAQVAEGYNRDYFLGDILKLNGEYELSEFVRVSEFIRTSDSSGEKAFPAFEVVSE